MTEAVAARTAVAVVAVAVVTAVSNLPLGMRISDVMECCFYLDEFSSSRLLQGPQDFFPRRTRQRTEIFEDYVSSTKR